MEITADARMAEIGVVLCTVCWGLTIRFTEEAFRYLGSLEEARKLGRSPESALLLTSKVNWRATASASVRPRKPAAQSKPAEALKMRQREKSSGMGPLRLFALALKYQRRRKKGAVALVAVGRGPLHAHMTPFSNSGKLHDVVSQVEARIIGYHYSYRVGSQKSKPTTDHRLQERPTQKSTHFQCD